MTIDILEKGERVMTKKACAYALVDGRIYRCEGTVSDTGPSMYSSMIFWPNGEIKDLDWRFKEIFGGRMVHWMGLTSCFEVPSAAELCWIFWIAEQDDGLAKEEFRSIYEEKRIKAENEVKKCESILNFIKDFDIKTMSETKKESDAE